MSLGKIRRGLKGNIKTVLKKVVKIFELDLYISARVLLVNSCERYDKLWDSIERLEFVCHLNELVSPDGPFSM